MPTKDKNNKKDNGKLDQLIGRVLRKKYVDKHPLIIDFFDNFSVYKAQGKTRKDFYKKYFPNGIYENQCIDLDQHITQCKK